MTRQFLGIIGLLAGFVLYQFTLRLPAPWDDILISLYFAALGVATIIYARGERWIQILGAVLIAFSLIRFML